jgi:hypothetical protein
MRALRLVQHMKTNADAMSSAVFEKIRASQKCSELLARVPAEEQKRQIGEIYSALTNWLATEKDAMVEQRYVALGMRRAEQGVPFSQMFWAVCIAREQLWEYIQQECLLDEPVEFWGGVNLLRSLNQFFDFSLYFSLIGYQKISKNGSIAAVPAVA